MNKLELSSQRLILNDNEVALVENKHISPPRLTSNVLEMSKTDHQMIEIALIALLHQHLILDDVKQMKSSTYLEPYKHHEYVPVQVGFRIIIWVI